LPIKCDLQRYTSVGATLDGFYAWLAGVPEVASSTGTSIASRPPPPPPPVQLSPARRARILRLLQLSAVGLVQAESS
jgi:hypothetical protein